MRDSNHRLTLAIPSFPCPGYVEPIPRLPALETLLARGVRLGNVAGSGEQRLFSLFGYESAGELPVGAVRRIGEGEPADRDWWCCADPVHFLAERDRVHLIVPGELEIGAEEARSLAQLFNDHFAQQGWQIAVAHPQRWYLRAPQPQNVRTVPLPEAASLGLRRALPTGSDALRWHSFLNETQMLFHQSEVNRRREQRGQRTINGIWPWGGGIAPALTRRFDEVWADDVLARGLALLAGSDARPLPPQWQRPATPDTLTVLASDGAWWLAAEERWFAPAKSALASGELEQLVIDGACGARYRADRHHLRRWWRRRQPLSVCS